MSLLHHDKTTAFKTAERRAQISRLYREGLSGHQIGVKLGISQQAVSKHIAVLTAEWKESAAVDFFMARAEQLSKIDLVEAEAWAAYRRTVGMHTKTTTKAVPVVVEGKIEKSAEVITVKELLAGEKGFLDTVLNAGKQRREIMGLDAPIKQAITFPDLDDARSEIEQRLNRMAAARPDGSTPDSVH